MVVGCTQMKLITYIFFCVDYCIINIHSICVIFELVITHRCGDDSFTLVVESIKRFHESGCRARGSPFCLTVWKSRTTAKSLITAWHWQNISFGASGLGQRRTVLASLSNHVFWKQ